MCRNTITCTVCCYYRVTPLFRFLTTLRGHVGQVYQISWSADSRLLCSGSSDSTLKVGVAVVGGTCYTILQ